MPEKNTFTALIIGGSLGGLAAAHELRSIGAEITVYERSPGEMQPRGAGIVMQPEVEALLMRLGATARSVSVELHERQQLHLHGKPRRYVAPQLMTSWDALYRTLREPLADACYHLDSPLEAVRVEGHDVAATFANGHTAHGNFLVGADGIGPTTRALLDPATATTYAGYVAWRGLEPESALPDDLLDLLSDRFTFFGANGMQLLCYLVPGPNGELAEGARRVNWVWYVNTAEENLPRLLTGRSGRRYAHFLPPGELTPEITTELLALATDSLPPQLTTLVRLSHVFMQPVLDLSPRRMVADHAVLMGDAAGTVRPHTASGTSKAFGDAAGLASALGGWAPPERLPTRRLEGWEAQRLAHLVTLAAMGMRLASNSSLGTTIGRQFLGA
ncbi:FAD-dependent monooxygenase [Saccharopolyspora shandongensis]|uniref:FAD binding domain-containing protein n=1 Tax=Saccharopolyspora shandongensis TaxID=418495 RepID=UPI0034170272